MEWPLLDHPTIPHEAVELENKEGEWFKVNGQRIKIYHCIAETAIEVIEAYNLNEV